MMCRPFKGIFLIGGPMQKVKLSGLLSGWGDGLLLGGLCGFLNALCLVICRYRSFLNGQEPKTGRSRSLFTSDRPNRRRNDRSYAAQSVDIGWEALNRLARETKDECYTRPMQLRAMDWIV
jgi:hypothetical protein